MEINMTYAIIGTGLVGTRLARFFAAKDIPVLIANSRGPKAFNQLPLKVLASPLPDHVGRRVVFVSIDHEDASATVAALAESLGFAAIEVGNMAGGGRLIQARGPSCFRISPNIQCR
jgi:predicted dinucleotide-binding enzyme